jgi:hypothetical protein
MKYRINLARTANRSIMQMNETGRINLSGFGEIKVTEQMGLQLNLTGAFPESKGNGATDPQAGFRSNFDSRTKLALLYPPVLLLQTAEEGFYYNMVNPVTALYDNDRVESRMNIFLSLQLNYRLSPHWLFTSGLSANGIDESLQNFYGSTSYYSTHLASDELRLQPAIKYSNEAKSLLFQKNELQYSFQNRNHNLRFSASQDITRSVYSYRAYIARGLPSRINFREQNSHLLPLSIAGNDSLHGIQNSYCWTASLEYQLLNRYKLTAFVRSVYTNSYLLSPRWQYLPYIELAWDADREKRLNYRLRRFSQIRFFVNAGYTADDRLQPSLFKLSDVPLDRSPMIDTGSIFEKTAKASAGADFTTRNGFMNGRIDFYYTSCNNLLLNNGGTICNMAAMETAGGDATIRFNLLQKSKCGLFAELNFSSSRNTVTSIGELKMYSGSSDWNSDIKDDFILLAGGSIGDIFGYVADGRYEVTDFLSYSATDNTWQLLPYVADASGLLGYAVRPGSMKLKDLNGDGRIDLNDRTILGNTLPKYTGGLSLWGYCGKVDFYLLFNGSYGNTIYNATKLEYTVSDKYDYRNLGAEMAQGMRWTYLLSDGSLCTEPAQLAILNSGTSMWSPIQQKAILSSYGVEDGSFLRLSQVNIGWNLPDKLLSRLMMQSGKVYISAYNLFTLSAYSGYMNEVSTRNSSRTLPTPGVDYSAFPACRTFMAGVSVKF